MKNHYRNTNSIAYLLLCLFITSSATAHSYIRQFTDDFNINQQHEAGSGQIQETYLHKNQEISSRDYKVSASMVVKALRDRPPSTYTVKMESFNTLLKSTATERYESRPFAVGEYNWTLIVYPNGNKKDGGSGYLSLYVAIDNSTLVGASKEVYADLRFYIYNKIYKNYLTIQDTEVWRFNVFNTMWGFSQVSPVDTFIDTRNGYLYDGDQCEFGVDITISSVNEKYEHFHVNDNIRVPKFTWSIRGFSTLLKDKYFSDVFSVGGRSWNIELYPSGHATGEGKAMSMFLRINEKEEVRPYEKIYVRAKLQVLNQRGLNNFESQLDTWFTAPGSPQCAWGYDQIISLADLRDSSKGFLVNDMVIVQAEFEAVSSTKYYP